MGNYYEGTVTIKLKKELPEDILNLLIHLNENDGIKPSNFENEAYFQKDRWDSPKFEFGYWIIKDEETDLLPFDFYNSEIKLQENNNDYIYGYYITINFCMKGYNNHMEEFLEFIRPYIHENARNYLGHIEDEDGHYNKDFFIDENLEQKEQSKTTEIQELKDALIVLMDIVKDCKPKLDLSNFEKLIK